MKNKANIIPIVFFLLIFILSVIPLIDFDIWFHLKSGEIISRLGIIRHDVFSHSAAGREWYPYEWLFQWFVFQFTELFGFESLKFLSAGFITLMTFVIYKLLRNVFDLRLWPSLILTLFFFSSVYEFFSARPHIIAYTFLAVFLYWLLMFLKKGSRFRFSASLVILAIIYLWANLHGSVFLSIYLAAASAVVCLVLSKKTGHAEYQRKAVLLAIFTPLVLVTTILPPLGATQYRLLWQFFLQRELITKFIDEWTPLAVNPGAFYYVTATIFIVIALTVFLTYRYKAWYKALILLPLLPFLIVVYSASRNVFLAYIAIVVLLGFAASLVDLPKLSKRRKLFFWPILAAFLVFNLLVLYDKRKFPRFFYPEGATKFIKNNHFKGNLFNEYAYGGYLLYHLYPEQKVFFDGRTDVYLCCEMPDTLDLAAKKNLPDSEYRQILERLWDKYKISYVLIRTQKHTVLRKMARILTDDRDWQLVFWDDVSQLFVRRDGKNQAILGIYNFIAATPYNQKPYRPGTEETAFEEYKRMIVVADSAKSRNVLGFLYLKKGDYGKARVEFEKAISLDPEQESAYMNLAEITAKEKDYYQAIKLYFKAQKLAQDRGLIYIRLGQLYLEGFNDRAKAKQSWEQGLKQTVDEDAKQQMRNLLKTL